jgi:hypothetical protein
VERAVWRVFEELEKLRDQREVSRQFLLKTYEYLMGDGHLAEVDFDE